MQTPLQGPRGLVWTHHSKRVRDPGHWPTLILGLIVCLWESELRPLLHSLLFGSLLPPCGFLKKGGGRLMAPQCQPGALSRQATPSMARVLNTPGPAQSPSPNVQPPSCNLEAEQTFLLPTSQYSMSYILRRTGHPEQKRAAPFPSAHAPPFPLSPPLPTQALPAGRKEAAHSGEGGALPAHTEQPRVGL